MFIIEDFCESWVIEYGLETDLRLSSDVGRRDLRRLETK